jgi:hypothetical protein
MRRTLMIWPNVLMSTSTPFGAAVAHAAVARDHLDLPPSPVV